VSKKRSVLTRGPAAPARRPLPVTWRRAAGRTARTARSGCGGPSGSAAVRCPGCTLGGTDRPTGPRYG